MNFKSRSKLLRRRSLRRKSVKVNRRKSSSRRRQGNTRRTQRGGGSLPIPGAAIAEMRLDPQDPSSPFVLVRKNIAEEEILQDTE